MAPAVIATMNPVRGLEMAAKAVQPACSSPATKWRERIGMKVIVR